MLHSSTNSAEVDIISVRSKRQRLTCSPKIDCNQSRPVELLETICQELRAVISSEISVSIKESIAVELNEMKDLFREVKDSVKFMSDDYDRIQSELKICTESSRWIDR